MTFFIFDRKSYPSIPVETIINLEQVQQASFYTKDTIELKMHNNQNTTISLSIADSSKAWTDICAALVAMNQKVETKYFPA